MTKIYYVEYDATHPRDFVYNIPEGFDCWLLILTQTPAKFWVNGEIKEYPSNSAVLYPPNYKIFYRACTDRYANDWVRFASTEEYLTETTLPLGVPFSVSDYQYCHKLFQLLATENVFNNDYRDLSIDYLFKILFNKLHEASHSTENSPHYQKLLDLRRTIHNNPGTQWTVPTMADQLSLSPGYLQALYKSTFGISCMADVINSRIHLAKEHLVHSSHTINRIATLCGYTNIEHFCRQFHQKTGSTPSEFRKSVQKN